MFCQGVVKRFIDQSFGPTVNSRKPFAKSFRQFVGSALKVSESNHSID